MEFLLNWLGAPLGLLMTLSYRVTNNYGLAILLFTLLTRVMLLPISIWLHQYSIRLVKMTPALLHARITYFGDQDKIAEEQSILYKEYRYNPMVTLIPLAIQIILLMGVIQVINHPFDYILHGDPEVVKALSLLASQCLGIPAGDSSLQLSAISMIQSGTCAQDITALASHFSQETLAMVVDKAKGFQTTFCGIDLLMIPSVIGGLTMLAPLAAGLASFVLCVVQNKANPLQAEQGTANKLLTMLLSVCLSMYLGYFVPMGVALYWIAGNLIAVLQQYLLNTVIPPQKHIDYTALKANREQLRKLQDAKKKNKRNKELVRREKQDIRRFHSVVNKHLVFYSESSGFYKYYRGIIEYLLAHSNLIIHYITSDPADIIFSIANKQERIRAYYVAEYKLISLMMKMDADMVVMTMPDLENYHIKRSYVRKDIEYVYIPHGMDSLNLTMRQGSLDHFDTVFCVGPHQKEEIERTETLNHLPHKRLIEWGYSLLDEMRRDYADTRVEKAERPRILIAPSWQADNIIDCCLEQLLDALGSGSYDVTVRPHPQEVRHKAEKMAELTSHYSDNSHITIQTDFSSNATVFEADLLITDWSGIAYEFAYTTLKPVLFINTPMKVMNPEYTKIEVVPLNISLREKIGHSLNLDELNQTEKTVQHLLNHKDSYAQRIEQFVQQYVYNLGHSDEIGAKAMIAELKNNRNIQHGRKSS